MYLGYLERIEKAERTITEYGVNPVLTQNSLDGLKELKKEFLMELSKDARDL